VGNCVSSPGAIRIYLERVWNILCTAGLDLSCALRTVHLDHEWLDRARLHSRPPVIRCHELVLTLTLIQRWGLGQEPVTTSAYLPYEGIRVDSMDQDALTTRLRDYTSLVTIYGIIEL
jgi:hypothetical protein